MKKMKKIKKMYGKKAVKKMLRSKKLVGSVGDPLAAAGQESTSFGVNAAKMFSFKRFKKVNK